MEIQNKDKYLELLKKTLTGYIYPESFYKKIEYTKLPHISIKQLITNLFVKILDIFKLKLYRATEADYTLRTLGKDRPFISYTLVGIKRLNILEYLMNDLKENNIDGDILEAGVWRGGASIYMRALLDFYGLNKQIFCADSFSGMPAPEKMVPKDLNYDLSWDEFLNCDIDVVRNNFKRFGYYDNVTFIKGLFNESLDSFHHYTNKLSLIRLDCDLYSSSMDVLKNTYELLSVGGFVVVDDYYDWLPCKTAIDEFRDSNNIKSKLINIDQNSVFWQKID